MPLIDAGSFNGRSRLVSLAGFVRSFAAAASIVAGLGPASIVAFVSGAAWAETPSPRQDESAEAPLPSADAMSALAGLAGRWTLDLGSTSETDAAGLVARQTVAWDEATSSLVVEWSTVDAGGTVVADGRGRIAYDDIAGAIINTYAGHDGDRRFSGSATLIAVDGAVTDWRGHETRGSGNSVNFEVTYDLRDPGALIVDFIPTCIDGLDAPAPVRFTWNRVDPFVEALPNAEAMTGAWVLTSGGHEGMPDGTTMSVGRGAGGRSLVFVLREPDRDGTPGAIMGTELIWLDPETGTLHDRYISVDGAVMDGTPRIGVRGEDEQSTGPAVPMVPVVIVRWGEDDADDQDGMGGMRLTSWMWVEGDTMHVAFTDAEFEGEPMPAPPELIWTRR